MSLLVNTFPGIQHDALSHRRGHHCLYYEEASRPRHRRSNRCVGVGHLCSRRTCAPTVHCLCIPRHRDAPRCGLPGWLMSGPLSTLYIWGPEYSVQQIFPSTFRDRLYNSLLTSDGILAEKVAYHLDADNSDGLLRTAL